MSEHPPSTDRPTGPVGSGHPEIDELAAYAAGDSGVADGDLVRAHLAGCADCTADIAALGLVSSDLAGLAMPSMPGDVAARLTAKLDDARAATDGGVGNGADGSSGFADGTVLPARKGRRSGAWASGAAAAVVVALVAAVGLNAINGSSDDDAKSTTAAESTTRRTNPVAVYASGTNYTAESIRGQVQRLLRQPAGQAEAPAAAGGDPLSAAPSTAAASSAAASSSAAAPAPAADAGVAASSAAAAAAAESFASPAQAAAPAATSAAASAASSEAASASASSAPAPIAGAQPAASSSAAPAAKSGDGAALASAPPADLTNLRNNPVLLAGCIASLTDGLVQPIAIDYASFAKDPQTPPVPALAIVLPSDTPGISEVYVVGGDCGTPAATGTFLHFATVPTG